MGLIRDVLGDYAVSGVVKENDILEAAQAILLQQLQRGPFMESPEVVENFLRTRMASLPHEEMHAIWLDTRHRVLGVEKLASGTIDGASIHCREVVRAALRINAAAVVLAHNHPSQNPEPSSADRFITKELCGALKLIDVRVIDHVVVGAGECVSFAKRGLI